MLRESCYFVDKRCVVPWHLADNTAVVRWSVLACCFLVHIVSARYSLVVQAACKGGSAVASVQEYCDLGYKGPGKSPHLHVRGV